MKKILILLVFLLSLIFTASLMAGSKEKGEKCNSDIECEFGLQCSGGVCTKKKMWDHGSSGKSGEECNNDADCIGSGKCVEGSFGKKYCSGS